MTCAKVVVRAELRTVCGQVFHGENWCLQPQQVCPRDPGEGYAKCDDVCQQSAHAEINAITKALDAGVNVRGANLIVNYHYICPDCQDFIDSYAINAVAVQPATGCDWRKMSVPHSILNAVGKPKSRDVPHRRPTTTRGRIKSGAIE